MNLSSIQQWESRVDETLYPQGGNQSRRIEGTDVKTRKDIELATFTRKNPMASVILGILKVIFFKNNEIWPFQLLVTSIFSLLKRSRGCPRGVMAKALDCGIVVREFVLQSRYYVHCFGQLPLGKV